MNATEEYLDKLLRGVSGLNEIEEDIETAEPVEPSDVSDADGLSIVDDTDTDGLSIVDDTDTDGLSIVDDTNTDSLSIVDEADALLSDLPLLDIPEDVYENDEEMSITSGIPVSIPVAADDDIAETVIDMDEEMVPDEVSDNQPIQDEIFQEEVQPEDISFEEILNEETLPNIEQVDDTSKEEIEIPSPDESPSPDEIPSLDETLDEQLGNTGLENIFNEETLEDEDIAALLQDIENMGKEEALIDKKNEEIQVELEDMLSESEDEDMSEIGDILIKDENNIPVDESLNDDMDFTSGMLSDEELFDGMEDILLDEADNNKNKKKKKKRRKKSKEDADIEESGEIKEKGKGFFARLLDVLVASDDDELEADTSVKFEESAVDIAIEGASENDTILAELEKAGDSKKKKKDKKKKNKKKGKDALSSDGDFDEEGSPSSEKDKKKAEKEKKKAEKARLKAEQKEKEALIPKKKLPKKKVIPVCILCFSLGVVITLCAFLMPSAFDKKQAKEQYDQHNYEETYSLLKGHSLSEKEQLMYDRTVTLLQEERKLDSYNNYMLLDMKPEALNALVQGVKKYDELSEKASELDVTNELDNIYYQIVNELNNSFGVSIDKARQWISIEDVEEYSYIINTYAKGGSDSVIDKMEEGYSDTTVEIDNPVISAEEAEIQ